MAGTFSTIFTGALQQVGNQLVKALQANLNRVVGRSSGNLSRSIQSVVRETPKGPEVVITMLPYGPVLDAGRGKSTKGGPQQTWRNKIEGWIDLKGITPKQGMTKEQAIDYVESNASEMKPTNDEFGYDSLEEQLNDMDIRRDKITNETQEINAVAKMF
jgi:hypothetical protein